MSMDNLLAWKKNFENTQMSLMNKSTLLILIPLMFVACSLTKSDPQADRSFLTDQPCAAPCWYGLEPGESSKAEVLETLKSLPFVDERSIKEFLPIIDDDGREEIDMIFGCVHPRNRYCGVVEFVDDQLYQLTLHVNYVLKLEMVVTKLGPPTKFYFREYHPEVGGCTMILAWPELGIFASHTNQKSSTLCDKVQQGEKVPGDVQINTLFYAVQEMFDGNYWYEWPGLQE